ncbi:MAG: PadR family transcriptional regulator [Gemmatimonadetes bacterium]|nr:PadR family transcriptional regulator [Gemmatimonadota bacterium]
MPKTPPTPHDFIPLTPPVFHILLAISDGARHGYAVIKEVEKRSQGDVMLSTGTLYAAMKRLLGDGLIEETDSGKDVVNVDERRRYYCLTGLGRKVARAEVNRMVELVSIAEEKRLVRNVALARGR